jgi:ribosomal-protein-alanine N-acetyltransferase
MEMLHDRGVTRFDSIRSPFFPARGVSMAIPVLETGHLQLRAFVPADAPTVQELAGAAEVAATTLNIAHPYPDGAAQSWISTLADRAKRGDGFAWAIVDRSNGTLMGAISIGVHHRHQRGEIGYWLGVPFWGRGYMTEAATAVVAHAFNAIGLHRVEAMILPRNRASVRVAEKAGLRHEGTLIGYVLKGSVFEDVAIYGRVGD